MNFKRSATRRIFIFVMGSCVLLPFGRAAARPSPQKAAPAPVAPAASDDASKKQLDDAMQRAGLNTDMQERIRFILAEADSGKVEIGRLQEQHKDKIGSFYVTYSLYDYRAELARSLDENTATHNIIKLFPAGKALYDAVRVAYDQYENPFRLKDKDGLPDPDNGKKKTLIEVGLGIIRYYDNDRDLVQYPGLPHDPRRLPEVQLMQTPGNIEGLWQGGPTALPEIYAAALAAPSAHVDSRRSASAGPYFDDKPTLAVDKFGGGAVAPVVHPLIWTLLQNDPGFQKEPDYKQIADENKLIAAFAGASYRVNNLAQRFRSRLESIQLPNGRKPSANEIRQQLEQRDPERQDPLLRQLEQQYRLPPESLAAKLVTDIVVTDARTYTAAPEFQRLIQTVQQLIVPNTDQMARLNPDGTVAGDAPLLGQRDREAMNDQVARLVRRLRDLDPSSEEGQSAARALAAWIQAADTKILKLPVP